MIVFQNSGSIDPRAFTTLGVHAKPNSDEPIGHFGTGLKYAIATILRVGGSIAILNDTHRYDFKTRPMNFRGRKIHKILCIRQEHNSGKRAYTFNLPFTTELGKHWVTWMAYRELLSNCRDEGGQEPFKGDTARFQAISHEKWHENGTTILVCHPDFEHIMDNPEEVQLHDNLKECQPHRFGKFEYYADEPNKYVYLKGLRVHTLNKPSQGTLNIVGHEVLTEDRTKHKRKKCSLPSSFIPMLRSIRGV